MTDFPTLSTDRLLLRAFRLSDADTVQRLAGAREVAANTFLPHPYEDGMAELWIESQRRDYEAGTAVNFAIALAPDDRLIGSIGLAIERAHEHARLGYWLGLPYWNRGYGTEAVNAVLDYGFTRLGLHRIYAPHFASNPASGRVLQKVGMTYEGRLREHYLRFGRHVDVDLYGMLRSDWASPPQP
jgi:RimJ/RimL family protein N-acetyltransferase